MTFVIWLRINWTSLEMSLQNNFDKKNTMSCVINSYLVKYLYSE